MSQFESVVEQAAIEWFESLGYAYAHGVEIAHDGPSPARESYRSVILEGRFRAALQRINPDLPDDTLEGVARKILRPESPSLDENNHAFHRHLTKGIEVQVRRDDGIRGDLAWLVDFEDPENNDWLVVSQFTVVEGDNNRRPDLVVFLNGLPVAVIELKNPEDPNATLQTAWNQIQTYKAQIPSLFNTNEIVVISDGTEARVGSLTAGMEWFGPWRTVDGEELAPDATPQLKVAIQGLFEKRRLLDYLRYFVLWETDGGWVKKIAGYHQYHAARKAVKATVRASRPDGDKRIGVVWHTQGSGKSLSMAFYAGMIVVEPAMENPTLVVITDRNDLDGQLYSQFCAAKDLIPNPQQAESREELRELLTVASGGVVFTTIQKFGTRKGERYPLLSDRRNIVVVADEAHRSHYEFIEGFARNLRDGLPNASFIGFTGTPIEFDDKSTPAVFGDYIDTYTISQSVEDERTVPLYYEARLAKIDLPEEKKPEVDEDFEEVTEGEEETVKGKLMTKWARLEAMVGTEERLRLMAEDLVGHWDRRQEILAGKAMVVCMSRRICVDLYDEIVRLRPEWHSDSDEGGKIKVVMTTSASDPVEFQPHMHGKARQKAIEKRFKDPDDPLEMVLVRDMWLTGFDVPCAHTLYLDKPMRGHTLMQAIARVNRVFRDKPSGLVVDYLGLAEHLRKAVAVYGGGRGKMPALPVEVALTVLDEKFGIVRDMFHGFDYSGYFGIEPPARLSALKGGCNHICGRDVAPLTAAEKKRLQTIFDVWRHPAVRDQPDQAARLGDGSAQAAERTIELLEMFLLAEIGRGNDLLYESSVSAIRRLLSEPAPNKMERMSATKELVLQVEPFAFKLLALLKPEKWAELESTRKGLDTALIQLSKVEANPVSRTFNKLPTSDFISRKGGEKWTSFEHAVRDVMGARLDTAHRATEVEPHLWRSTLCVLLGLIAHNEKDIARLPAVAPGSVDGPRRFVEAMARLNSAAGIAIHLEGARHMRDEVGYFQAVHRNLKKHTLGGSGKSGEELDAAIRQIVSEAVSSEGVVDIFGTTGLKKPDISILSDEFLETVRISPHKNLQLEVLKKLLNDEIRTMSRRNIVQGRKFSEMLAKTVRAYQNRTLEAAKVILELIRLAKEMRDAPKRGDDLGLSEDEVAFYDALADHGDVREIMGDETLAAITHDLVETIRNSVTIDWTQKRAVRARMRTRIRRLLRKHGYPPDKRQEAVDTVIEQAEQVCRDWGEAA